MGKTCGSEFIREEAGEFTTAFANEFAPTIRSH
jgi:hypothetical protein